MGCRPIDMEQEVDSQSKHQQSKDSQNPVLIGRHLGTRKLSTQQNLKKNQQMIKDLEGLVYKERYVELTIQFG